MPYLNVFLQFFYGIELVCALWCPTRRTYLILHSILSILWLVKGCEGNMHILREVVKFILEYFRPSET